MIMSYSEHWFGQSRSILKTAKAVITGIAQEVKITRKTRRRFIKVKYLKGITTATQRSRTKVHRFTTEANGNKFLKSLDNPLQSPSSWQKNNEGTVLNPTKKSATARETMNALVLVRSRRLLQTRKIIDPFPLMVRMERDQPRIQNQVSIFYLL